MLTDSFTYDLLEFLNEFGAALLACLEDDVCLDGLAALGIGKADYRRLSHGRVF